MQSAAINKPTSFVAKMSPYDARKELLVLTEESSMASPQVASPNLGSAVYFGYGAIKKDF